MLPFLNSTNRTTGKQVVAFRGINYSDRTTDGDLRDSLNLSARRFPYLSTRFGRSRVPGVPDGIRAIASWNGELIYIDADGYLHYGEKKIGGVTFGHPDTRRTFAVVNSKLVIWPDKMYMDLGDLSIHYLNQYETGTGAKFTTSKITVTGDSWSDLTQKFKVGDCITISGCKVKETNNKDVVIKGITATEITVGENEIEAGEETGEIGFHRAVPNMDYICESENRLWGCSNETQTIYASALGDPTNFHVFEGVSTDSYAVAVGTEGKFTGCCKHSSSVLFWKENKLHKLLGSYPAEYSIYTYDINGVRDGCAHSLQIINEVLYYAGLHGVYAYSGGVPGLISDNFGDLELKNAVAGSDGDKYYLHFTDDKRHLMVYDTRTSIWVREDDVAAHQFARVGKKLYFMENLDEYDKETCADCKAGVEHEHALDGVLWLVDDTEEADLEWMAQFTPFYETAQGRKRYTKLLLRTELPKGSWMRVEVRSDEGKWREVGKLVGREVDSIPMQVPINRCDRFEVRLSGRGSCTILTMMLEYQVGSDV